MTFILTGQKLFVPSRHLWLRAKQIPTSLTSSTSRGIAPSVSHGSNISISISDSTSWRIDVGITNRGLEDIGDVQSYEFHHDILAAMNTNSKGEKNDDAGENEHAHEHEHEHAHAHVHASVTKDIHNFKVNTITVNTSPSKSAFESERDHEKANASRNINATTVLRINWDAHLITAADELYHTIWETVSESTDISTPIDGNIEEINTSILTKQKAGSIYVTPALDEDTTLFTLRTSYTNIEYRMKEEAFICCEDEYEEIVQTSERGRFYEEEGEIV
eukprot:CAMPEP_0194097420 /NCGR_PEP_ID=MMETSP0149-20130528/57858_1 /TAXON_ID=122233 /ORGANISM="Chaetoceros debilis, Strain MM31A-1" /LENGTH=275 /DNA_ID=CAMNT_0038783445 /DNA_START=172 /DNA_END=1000 /DNA_ORIENTATION=+